MYSVMVVIMVSLLVFGCVGVCYGRDKSEVKEKIIEYQIHVEDWLTEIDSELSQFNTLFAHITWKLSTDPDVKTSEQAKQLAKAKNQWRNKVCDSDIKIEWLTAEQNRKIYLLCRGPRFSDELSDIYMNVMEKLSNEYNTELCLDKDGALKPKIFEDVELETNYCVHGEPDLERAMKNMTLSPDEKKWIWLNWHNSVGPRLRDLYRNSVFFQNLAAQTNGYEDMSQVWQEELEIPNLDELVVEFYNEIKPLYLLLHAFIRHILTLKYGPSIVDPKGPIPIHLLGNMWGQDWSAFTSEIFSSGIKFDLDEHMKAKNWTVQNMVSLAEDYYVSMGFPRLTENFWKYSIFERTGNSSVCHGSAANMHSSDDFRILFCAEISMEDLHVIHHEMGHIMYYMAYAEQPAIFQEGTNSAFHESIGDAIMHGVLTPQHLHRLGIITDEDLTDPLMEIFLLFHQALSQIPELPFALMLDKYRWDIFRGKIPFEDYNKAYWDLNLRSRGLVPPEIRDGNYFDAGGKFHVPDNTPYIRYFLSGIMQLQIFESLCDTSLFGTTNDIKDQKDYLRIPLHRCDLYGSKKVGKKIMSVLEKGASIKWDEAIRDLTGKGKLSTKSLLRYYQPVYDFLKDYIDSRNVFVGW